jgi:hypothetical protein
VTGTESAAWAMFVVVSCKKAALNSAACSGRRGGHSRVLEKPGRGVFAMTPMAQLPFDAPTNPLDSNAWPFIEEITPCPPICGRKGGHGLGFTEAMGWAGPRNPCSMSVE